MSNVDRLTEAGIIPKGYDKLSEEDEAAINSMSEEEVAAVISASSKIHHIMEKGAPHGMAY